MLDAPAAKCGCWVSYKPGFHLLSLGVEWGVARVPPGSPGGRVGRRRGCPQAASLDRVSPRQGAALGAGWRTRSPDWWSARKGGGMDE